MTLVEKMKEFETNTKWIGSHYREMQATYPDEWIAIWKEEVVGHSTDIVSLREYLQNQFPIDYEEIPAEYMTSEDVHLILGNLGNP